MLAAPRIDFMRTPILPVPFDDTTTALVAQINKVIESHGQSQRNFYYYMTEVEGHLLTLDLQPTPNSGSILRGAMLTTYVERKAQAIPRHLDALRGRATISSRRRHPEQVAATAPRHLQKAQSYRHAPSPHHRSLPP